MGFSEELKLKVKRRSAFQCCRCREIGVEVHHIVPEADGGADVEENAAPLCPNCHTRFGDNPKKRKEIKQMRDWWYNVCDEKHGGREDRIYKKLDELLAEVRRQTATEEERRKAISEISRTLGQDVEASLLSETDNASQVASKTDRVVTATRLAEGVWGNVHCSNCGSQIGLLIGPGDCPNCGAPI